MALPKRKFKVGPGNLSWIFINGDGALNDLGEVEKYEYKATLTLPEEEAKPYIEQLEALWEEYTNGKKVKATTLGFKYEEDDEGERTGNVNFTFKTNVEYADRKGNLHPSVVKVFRANGQEITENYHATEKKAANGSQGILHGTAAVYENKANKGITLYLAAVQFTKFVEYTGAVDVEAVTGDVDDGLSTDVENFEEETNIEI